MRFIYGPIPESRTFDPVGAGWTPLREGEGGRFVSRALLWTIPFLVAATMSFLRVVPALRVALRHEPWALPCVVLLLLALVPAHEFIHALAYGCGLRSPNLLMGVWPQ